MITIALSLVTSKAAIASNLDPSVASDEYKVGHQRIILIDTTREDREITVNIWYPVDSTHVGGTPALYTLGFKPEDFKKKVGQVTLASPVLTGDAEYDNRIALAGDLAVAEGEFPLIMLNYK